MSEKLTVCGHEYVKGEDNVYVATEEFTVNPHQFTANPDMDCKTCIFVGIYTDYSVFPKYVILNKDMSQDDILEFCKELNSKGVSTIEARGYSSDRTMDLGGVF